MADDRDEELITRLVEDEIILRRYGNLNEGQYQAKQREIDKLWQQDENSLNFLRDSLRNSNDVTNKMVRLIIIKCGYWENMPLIISSLLLCRWVC